MKREPASHRGFTLIELIVTLTVAALLGVVIYQYQGTSLARSSEPVLRLQKSLALKQVAENISADYKKNYTKNLPDLMAKIVDGSQQAELVGYGVYTILESTYVTFDANNQEATSTDERILKVTIGNDQNNIITMFFVYQGE